MNRRLLVLNIQFMILKLRFQTPSWLAGRNKSNNQHVFNSALCQNRSLKEEAEIKRADKVDSKKIKAVYDHLYKGMPINEVTSTLVMSFAETPK